MQKYSPTRELKDKKKSGERVYVLSWTKREVVEYGVRVLVLNMSKIKVKRMGRAGEGESRSPYEDKKESGERNGYVESFFIGSFCHLLSI